MFGLPFIGVFLLATSGAGREFPVADFHRLPQLYHLDNYERCLSKAGGLYCRGTFELTPQTKPHPVFELMQERTNQHLTFNRTLIHRGYCVSERCKTQYHNATHRFERCASLFAKRGNFNARLLTAQCKTSEQYRAEAMKKPDYYQRMFAYVVCAILFLNVLGTAYDVASGDNKKSSVLTAWSLRVNWAKIFDTTSTVGSTEYLNGFKVAMQLVIVYAHSGSISFLMYSYNPEGLENISRSMLGNLLRNGSTIVVVFLMISSYFTANGVHKMSKRTPITASILARMVLKKIFRIAPVMLLVVAFAATWWPSTGDGPLWDILKQESKNCRRNFWYYALFVNNMLPARDQCLVPSWAMTVDLQNMIVSLLLTVFFMKSRLRATTGLGMLFCASVVLNILLAYVYSWEPLGKLTTPENLRIKYANSKELSQLHLSPWGNLPGTMCGLFCAHFLLETKRNKEKEEGNRDCKESSGAVMSFAKSNAISLLTVAGVSWVLFSRFIDSVESRVVVAIFVGIERLIMSLLFAVGFLQLQKKDGYRSSSGKGAGYFKRLLSWRGWAPFYKLSFSVAMIHWCVNLTLAAQRPVLTPSSLSYIALDWIQTVVISYALAIPLTLMVELPALNLSSLIF